MASTRQCPKCGFDLTDTGAHTCPACGTKIDALAGTSIWWGALIQFTISSVFMLVFGFPRIMIAIFGALIVIGTALSPWLKARSVARTAIPKRPVLRPVLFRILSLGILFCSFVFVAILLFGFVIFMNAWSRWQQYDGASYHRGDFQVTRVYYQTHSRGGPDIFASGTVDGQREWMNLQPYLHTVPQDELDLDSRVPVGTSIPVYVFPDLQGRSRVQVFNAVPPGEANHRTAMTALNYGLCGLALTAGAIFALARLRRACYQEPEAALATT
jgi:hypothetical protein